MSTTRTAARGTTRRVVPADDLQGQRRRQVGVQARRQERLRPRRHRALRQGHRRRLQQRSSPEHGLTVLGRDGIDGKATDYKALAEKIKATNPDLVYYGGITQNNAGKLWRRPARRDARCHPHGSRRHLRAASASRPPVRPPKARYITFGGRAAGAADRQGCRLRRRTTPPSTRTTRPRATPPTATRRRTSSSRPSSGPRRRTRPTSLRSARPSSTRSWRRRTMTASSASGASTRTATRA